MSVADLETGALMPDPRQLTLEELRRFRPHIRVSLGGKSYELNPAPPPEPESPAPEMPEGPDPPKKGEQHEH